MKIFTSKTSLFVFLTISIAICASSYFWISLGVDQYARGFTSSVILLALITTLTFAVGIYFAKSVFVPLKLAYLPVFDFTDAAVTYREPEGTKKITISYDQILSVVITENLGRYAPSRLVVTQADRSTISIVPTFDRPNKLVMEQFEKRCSVLRRRYKWQWSSLYRTDSAAENHI